MLVRIDLTGKKFTCKGKTEWEAKGWAYGFRVGSSYYEAINPELDKSGVMIKNHILYLYNSFGEKKYVDAIEFMEVEQDLNETRSVVNRVPFSMN